MFTCSLSRILISLFLLHLSFWASAFEVSPMSSTIMMDKGKKEIKLAIESDGKAMTAIEISVAKRTVDDLGKETLVETEDFYVYPPQLILKPFETRSIKVKWRGDKTPLVEEACRTIAC